MVIDSLAIQLQSRNMPIVFAIARVLVEMLVLRASSLVPSPSQLFNVSRRKVGGSGRLSHVRNITAASYLMNVGETTAGMLPMEDRYCQIAMTKGFFH